jgi:hypothetical protein
MNEQAMFGKAVWLFCGCEDCFTCREGQAKNRGEACSDFFLIVY